MFPLDKNIQEVVIELRNDNQDIYIMQKKGISSSVKEKNLVCIIDFS